MDGTKVQSIRDEVTCPVCLDFFRNPVIIGCGHSFCWRCISGWAEAEFQAGFPCPECRAPCPRGPFPPNWRLRKLTDIIQHHNLGMKAEFELFREDVKLDDSTAHPLLIVSEDGKSARLGPIWKNLPPNSNRFSLATFVLDSKTVTSGRHFWEVEVGEKRHWAVGICRESASRKGKIILNPQNGYWAIGRRRGQQVSAGTDPHMPLSLKQLPHRVGIYLDMEMGEISFYNPQDRSHIFTFPKNIFKEPLRLFLCPGI
ncbi:E3 ubiquitin-protein ligase TRIM68-like [Tachyglossus aculeatus]|uniref:E3 ubiquitin-protein ligase TRIM68-like n=1 Tax=Tachyglossus aculeatus TaxID=9261 RepID=UPI0018F59F0D|nr:E3 ubiquitin-protein ligase TRIM68-like [Tachyglossus aculeatus]